MGAAPVSEAVHHRRFRWRGSVGTLLLVPAALVSLFSPPLFAETSWWHFAVRTLAWATFLVGGGFRFWATLYVGGRKERELVADGPYSIVRHPLYVGSLLIGVSAGLFLESVMFELALAVVAVMYATATVPVEEAVLASRHPDEYKAYSERVPRFWPSWRHYNSPPKPRFDVHSLRLECARASRWCWIPLVGEVLTSLHARAWWPHLFRLF